MSGFNCLLPANTCARCLAAIKASSSATWPSFVVLTEFIEHRFGKDIFISLYISLVRSIRAMSLPSKLILFEIQHKDHAYNLKSSDNVI